MWKSTWALHWRNGRDYWTLSRKIKITGLTQNDFSYSQYVSDAEQFRNCLYMLEMSSFCMFSRVSQWSNADFYRWEISTSNLREGYLLQISDHEHRCWRCLIIFILQQFRYKSRVYRQPNIDEKQIAKLHTKVRMDIRDLHCVSAKVVFLKFAAIMRVSSDCQLKVER